MTDWQQVFTKPGTNLNKIAPVLFFKDNVVLFPVKYEESDSDYDGPIPDNIVYLDDYRKTKSEACSELL